MKGDGSLTPPPIVKWCVQLAAVVDDETLLSPVVLLGPSDVVLHKPVVISFRHCADVRQGCWVISVFATFTDSEQSLTRWQVRYIRHHDVTLLRQPNCNYFLK